MAKVIRDEGHVEGYTVTLDRSEGGRYSVLGPVNGTTDVYSVRDHEDDAELGRGTRDEMIALVERLDNDRLS
jgi:hypothetical protein